MRKRLISTFLYFGITASLFASCKKNQKQIIIEIPPVIEVPYGKWLESIDKIDTITIDNMFLLLSRPKEIRSGYLLPQFLDGPYNYQFAKEVVSLHWGLSSAQTYKSYPYKIEGGKLHIRDFYQKTGGQELTLIFDKLK